MRAIFILLSLFTLLFTNCSSTDKASSENETPDNILIISKAQFAENNMHLVSVEKQPICNSLSFTGKIVPKINALVQISPLLEGYVSQILVSPGQKVNKGYPIVKIGGNALLDLQKDFAVTQAKIKLLEEIYLKEKELYEQQLGTKNKFLQAESNYKSEEARLNAMKLKLKLLGINEDDLNKGTFKTTYTILAPETGYIEEIRLVKGQYAESGQTLAVLSTPDQSELKLELFADHLHEIEPGQKVVIQNNGEESKYFASISRIGQMMDAEHNTFSCFAELNPHLARRPALNQVVTGYILTHCDSVWAVPARAVISTEEAEYIVVQTNENDSAYLFQRMLVKTGRQNRDFVEILDPDTSKLVLANGGFQLSF